MLRKIFKKISVFILVRILLAPIIFIIAMVFGIIKAECELVKELSSETIVMLKDIKRYVKEGLH